ncbi:unnamed protein product [Cylicocyclus nassatus]|uniref:Uncharacterized protein n=1 Tax=Cylicocyclus nassatus TaxID=53992 RepID=A0AA36HDB9_CYLNA|nr:unnamed protein product [Cylicocyclus nassatus]
MIDTLPSNVKCLFPQENLEFAESITEDESKVLKEVFQKHACFEEVGEMIAEVDKRDHALADRMRKVLAANCSRLEGLSPNAVEFSKKAVSFVTHVMCSMTLGKQACLEKADEIHEEFQKLPAADQEALKKAHPDVKF